jgi:hypothetical protein
VRIRKFTIGIPALDGFTVEHMCLDGVEIDHKFTDAGSDLPLTLELDRVVSWTYIALILIDVPLSIAQIRVATTCKFQT